MRGGQDESAAGEIRTEYESAVVFGVASEVYGSERYDALLRLLEKYCPEFIEEGKRYIELKDTATKIIKIDIRHITGKARRCVDNRTPHRVANPRCLSKKGGREVFHRNIFSRMAFVIR